MAHHICSRWMQKQPGLELLWDAFDGDGVQAATKIVRGMPGGRIDDTTVVVIQLWEITQSSARCLHFLPLLATHDVYITPLNKSSLTFTSTGSHCSSSFSASAVVGLSISTLAGKSTPTGITCPVDVKQAWAQNSSPLQTIYDQRH